MFLYNAIAYGFGTQYFTIIGAVGLVVTLALWYEDSVFKRKMDLIIVAILMIAVVADVSLKCLDMEADLLDQEFTQLCKTDLNH